MKELQEPLRCRSRKEEKNERLEVRKPMLDYEDVILIMSIICATLTNAVLILAGWWVYADSTFDWILIIVGFTGMIAYAIYKAFTKLLRWIYRKQEDTYDTI